MSCLYLTSEKVMDSKWPKGMDGLTQGLSKLPIFGHNLRIRPCLRNSTFQNIFFLIFHRGNQNSEQIKFSFSVFVIALMENSSWFQILQIKPIKNEWKNDIWEMVNGWVIKNTHVRCAHAHESQRRAGVPGHCERPDFSAGNSSLVPSKAMNTLSYWTISPVKACSWFVTCHGGC